MPRPVSSRAGRSPRARGSHRDAGKRGDLCGSIPAGAGEPLGLGPLLLHHGVDPRGRGGALVRLPSTLFHQGRSPRARGSRGVQLRSQIALGSIPAGAGEPQFPMWRIAAMRVDPRGRGGAGNVAASAGVNPGRSPRARGSPRGVVIPDVDIGSIPAGAGEPSPTAAAPAPTRVDPRGRGGAHPAAPVRGGDRGRSPRARGSLRHAPGLQVRHGSIPAGAGEPRYRASRSTGNWVDPRGRGGADEVFVGIVLTAGRSPRARGSHLLRDPERTVEGSIPAGAGEP